MFTGMIRVENHVLTQKTDSTCHQCAARTGGDHRRSFRRPGCVGINLLDTSKTKAKYTSTTVENSNGKLPCKKLVKEDLEREKTQDLSDKKKIPQMQPCSVFNSSFSFIQQSLETRVQNKLLDSDLRQVKTSKLPLLTAISTLSSPFSQSENSLMPISQSEANMLTFIQSENSTMPINQSKTNVMPISQTEIKTVPTTHLITTENKINIFNLKETSKFLINKLEQNLFTVGPSETSSGLAIQSGLSIAPVRQSDTSTVLISLPETSTGLIKQLEAPPFLVEQSEICAKKVGQSDIGTILITEAESMLTPIDRLKSRTGLNDLSESRNVSSSQLETNTDSVEQLFANALQCGQSTTSFSPASQSKTSVTHTKQSDSGFVGSGQSEDEILPLHFLHSIGQSVQQKGLPLAGELWLLDQPSETNQSELHFTKEILQDSDSVETETIDSSESVSSVTSGYESTYASSEPIRDGPMKKYEDILQDCLQNNRTNIKIESMMAKLQRLQHKAILDDDIDTAEHFGKKLEDLRRERVSLKPGLPSRRSEISEFLEQLRTAVNSAIHRMHSSCRNDDNVSDASGSEGYQSRERARKKLLEEKQRIQNQMCVLQRRLQELQMLSTDLDLQLELAEEIRTERSTRGSVQCLEELLCPQGPSEGPWGCDHALEDMISTEGLCLRACDLAPVLEDLLSSEHRLRISVCPPEAVNRLQEQEQALSLSIKEEMSKVVLNQRLAFGLSQKIAASEAQLLTLHKAKLSAVSGNEFSIAKELKAEIRSVCGEKEHLETLLQKLQRLGGEREEELKQVKKKHSQIKLKLQEEHVQHECSLKENTLKYMEFLEDRVHSCGSAMLERVLEADLEACLLLLKTLEQRNQSATSEMEEHPPFTKEEADCAMLTALGGRWCPETDLQHSQFTKKLEEFLFSLEEVSPEDLCEETADEETAELTERCTFISERLHYLEEQLQTAMDNSDRSLTLSLEKEVQEVKAALQEMMSQLKEEEVEDDEQYCDVEEEDLEEEELYFSDTWEI